MVSAEFDTLGKKGFSLRGCRDQIYAKWSSMASEEKEPSPSWVDGVASIIDAVTNLYATVAAKSPLVADTVVILTFLLPFFWLICRQMGISTKEKNETLRVTEARKASKKRVKKISGGQQK